MIIEIWCSQGSVKIICSGGAWLSSYRFPLKAAVARKVEQKKASTAGTRLEADFAFTNQLASYH